MPLIIDGGRVPTRWAERGLPRPASSEGRRRNADGLQLALINNMPDAALEDTELQFFELLDVASDGLPVVIRLYSLTGVPRAERGERHLNSFYFPFDDLWENQFDGVIITGTEPHHPKLVDEPYWGLMTQVIDWAERNTTSTILSCLAAHASVFHGDGIQRHPLPDKKFGLFRATKASAHPLTSGTQEFVRFPHSRWNEVRESELEEAGYTVLTRSAEAGVDLFVKEIRQSLFVHFQGHPEYGAQTLAKEYRRDVRRYLRGERESYPTMPHDYFDEAATRSFNALRERALSRRHEEVMTSFPESTIDRLERTWSVSATAVYRNWLQLLSSRRNAVRVLAGVSTA